MPKTSMREFGDIKRIFSTNVNIPAMVFGASSRIASTVSASTQVGNSLVPRLFTATLRKLLPRLFVPINTTTSSTMDTGNPPVSSLNSACFVSSPLTPFTKTSSFLSSTPSFPACSRNDAISCASLNGKRQYSVIESPNNMSFTRPFFLFFRLASLRISFTRERQPPPRSSMRRTGVRTRKPDFKSRDVMGANGARSAAFAASLQNGSHDDNDDDDDDSSSEEETPLERTTRR